jgi:tetratricopeptide (TPR) repeat protein
MAMRRAQQVGRGIKERAKTVDTVKQAKGPFLGTMQAGPARPMRAHGLSDEHQERGLLYVEKQHWDDAIVEFKKSVDFTPEFSEGYNNMGVCCLYTNKLNEAVEALRNALKHFPGWATAQANLGLVYQRQKDYAKAADYYQQSVGKQRNQPQVWAALAECYELIGKPAEAVEAYRSALSVQPKYDYALLRLGLALARRNELDEAERNLQQALEFDPNLSEALAVLGAIAARRGNLDSARDYFTKAQKAHPSKVPPVAARGLTAIETYAQRAQSLFAEVQADSIDEDLPSVAECLFNAGLSYVKAGDIQRAHGVFTSAVAEDAEWAEPRVWAGLIDAVNNRPVEARKHLDAAKKLEPENGLIHEMLGVVCTALGYSKEADRNFEEARKHGRQIAASPAGSGAANPTGSGVTPAAPSSATG